MIRIKPNFVYTLTLTLFLLICAIVFAYMQKNSFSHDETRLIFAESAATPYSATVRINKIEYATGLGSSKKQAKLEGGKIII